MVFCEGVISYASYGMQVLDAKISVPGNFGNVDNCVPWSHLFARLL